LHHRTHRDRGGTADQSTHGRTGFGKAYKAENSRKKNVLIENCGGKNYILGLKEPVFTETTF
jgi:hypothetical protein